MEDWIKRAARLIWSPITMLWAEVKGLRTEQIRSAAFVACALVLGYSLGLMHRKLVDPYFVLALLGLVAMIALAMQATSIKGQWGKAMIELGRDPDPDNRTNLSDTNPENNDA